MERVLRSACGIRGGLRDWACVAAVLAAGGCSTGEAQSAPVVWTKPGVEIETVRLEFGLCGGDFTPLGAPRFAPADFAEIDACMQRKGFARAAR